MTCQKPPEGWNCTRYTGHDGPCAAVPSQAVAEPYDVPDDLRQMYIRVSDRSRQPMLGWEITIVDLIERVGRAEGARDRQYEYNVEQIAKQAALEAERDEAFNAGIEAAAKEAERLYSAGGFFIAMGIRALAKPVSSELGGTK